MTIRHYFKRSKNSHEHMNNNEVQSPHLLVIDDEPDQLRLLVAALRNTSYRVSVALNAVFVNIVVRFFKQLSAFFPSLVSLAPARG